MDLSKQLPDDFVDLVVTSPPYADTLSYGEKVNTFHTDNYVDWFLPYNTTPLNFKMSDISAISYN